MWKLNSRLLIFNVAQTLDSYENLANDVDFPSRDLSVYITLSYVRVSSDRLMANLWKQNEINTMLIGLFPNFLLI